MRTTLDLEDHLIKEAKRRAAETGQTLTSLIEAALRQLLEQEGRPKKPYRFKWVIVKGGAQPGVDITDRDHLFDLMEGRS